MQLFNHCPSLLIPYTLFPQQNARCNEDIKLAYRVKWFLTVSRLESQWDAISYVSGKKGLNNE
jgi:hypothetical protein